MYLNTETVGAVEVEVLISDDNQSAYSTNKGEKGIVQTNQLVKSKYKLPWRTITSLKTLEIILIFKNEEMKYLFLKGII